MGTDNLITTTITEEMEHLHISQDSIDERGFKVFVTIQSHSQDVEFPDRRLLYIS